VQVLVDTSVWSLGLRRRKCGESGEVIRLKELIADGRVEIIGAVRQEILSGIRESRQFDRLRLALEPFPDVAIETSDYEDAARICNACQVAGIVTGTVDCLIASVSMRNGWELLTTDLDFTHMASCVDLRLHRLS